MKKILLIYLFCLSICAYARQITDSISISSSDNVVNFVMSATDYNNWIQNDGFTTNNQKQPKMITSKLYQYFKDDFDVIMLITDEEELPTTISYYGMNMSIANKVEGIGKSIFSSASSFGSAGRLFSLMHLPFADAIKYGPTLHEFCHCWANSAIPTIIDGHWGVCGGNTKGQLGGFEQSTLLTNVDGNPNKYSVEDFGVNANEGNGVPYNELELYLMGMLPIDSVQEFDAFLNVDENSFGYTDESETRISFISDTRIHYTQASLIELLGERQPDFHTSQKDFKALFVVLSQQPLTSEKWEKYESMINWFCKTSDDGNEYFYNFWEATRGIGSIDPSNLSLSLKTATSVYDIIPDTYTEIRTLPSTIICPHSARIYNLAGQDVTQNNGSLPGGIYIVRTTNGIQKVIVK